MADGKNKIIVYRDWITTFEELTDEEAGRIIKHFFRYVNDLNPEPPDRFTKLVFEPIKQTLKRDLKNYETICLRNQTNGKSGGRPKKPKKPSGLFQNPKKPDNDSDNDSDNDKDIKMYNKIPPNIEDIKKRIIERNITQFTAEDFFAHYQANGWMIGKAKMKDWNAALTTWKNRRYENDKRDNQRRVKRTNDLWNTENTVPTV